MTTSQVADQPDAIDSENASSENVALNVSDLIIGRKIDFPIHDNNGVLLLAAGSVVTSEFKKNLTSRFTTGVQVDARDAKRLVMSTSVTQIASANDFALDSELTKKLDSVIDSGLLFVANSGPSHRNEMVFHGRKAYDPEARENLIAQHQASSESLDKMMSGILKGATADGSQISTLVASYLTDMTADADQLLSIATEVKSDRLLADHALKSSILAMAIAVEMGLDSENVRKIGVIGLVHDWGMIKVSKEIRNATRSLEPDEILLMQRHPIHSLEMLEKVSGMPSVVPLVSYQIHERINGKGYPRGRIGKSIHQFARIIQVADIYVALTSPRPYRPPYMPYRAMTMLLQEARTKSLDPDVVRSLLQVYSLFPIGSHVALSDGSTGRTLRRNRTNYTHPIVQRLQDADGNLCDPQDADNLLELGPEGIQIVQALPTPGKNELAECLERN